ncbi:hypothetical protein JCM19232_4235 [Vibrio ishigakensis]|uniref:Uncharacterized protein n=1 Tax=Vibrio ishigakensis TaxID=1481914 RepID=A0A0B8PE67_9VIBR|nr:hypothetical protein JCM19232_4235 [Vibrio ishigakensis]
MLEITLGLFVVFDWRLYEICKLVITVFITIVLYGWAV